MAGSSGVPIEVSRKGKAPPLEWGRGKYSPPANPIGSLQKPQSEEMMEYTTKETVEKAPNLNPIISLITQTFQGFLLFYKKSVDICVYIAYISYIMQNKTLRELEKRIEQIKRELQTINEMRPGSLTCQYHNPKEKKGAYYQLSYTHKMKSRTDYVRSESVPQIREQIAEYKRFRVLVDEWVALAIKRSKIQMDKGKRGT